MKKKILFIVKDKKSYENFIKNINKFSDFGDKFLLSFNRELYEKITTHKFLKKNNIFDANHLIEKNINLNGKKISSILKKLLIKNSDFYLSKFSELNNADNFFYDYLANDAISKIIKKKNITDIYNFYNANKNLKKNNISFFEIEKKQAKLTFFLKCLFISLKNFLNEIFLSLILKKDFLEHDKLIVANLKDNWIKKKIIMNIYTLIIIKIDLVFLT